MFPHHVHLLLASRMTVCVYISPRVSLPQASATAKFIDNARECLLPLSSLCVVG